MSGLRIGCLILWTWFQFYLVLLQMFYASSSSLTFSSMILYFWVSLRMMILRKRNSLHTLLNWTQTIMIFMKCSWVPYNLCLSTAILKGVNIFCILWLATKHHQSKLDLYQPQSLKRVSLSLCCCYCQMTTHCKNLW